MPRIARLKLTNLTYHAISRGNNKMQIFIDDADYEKYLEILNRYQEKFAFWIYNFNLMPNHVHQLLKAESDISRIMHGINLSYAQYYKAKYNHSGHFWQDRFKSYIVADDLYFLTVARYIERNPLKAKLIKELKSYKYSSYNFYAYGENCGVNLTPNPLFLELFGTTPEDRKRYREFINSASAQTGETDTSDPAGNIPLIPNIVKEQFIGSPEVARELIATKFPQRIKPKRGRPKKNQQILIPNLL
ncbi:MAG: transposase [Candidatus Omnitrophota bacterium]